MAGRGERVSARREQWLAEVRALEAAGVSPKEARAQVRSARRAAVVAARAAGHPQGDPRAGDDRRTHERRRAVDADENRRILEAMGIADRRRAQRRRGGDRRAR